jgi:hypothetical protein
LKCSCGLLEVIGVTSYVLVYAMILTTCNGSEFLVYPKIAMHPLLPLYENSL